MNNSSQKCVYCNRDKIRIWSGKQLKDGSKIYIDDSGKRWAGRRCPACEKKRVKFAIKLDTFKKKLIAEDLKAQGYKLKSFTYPLTAEKGGLVFSLGVQEASVKNGKIVLENELNNSYDLYVLLFQTARVCTPEVIQNSTPWNKDCDNIMT